MNPRQKAYFPLYFHGGYLCAHFRNHNNLSRLRSPFGGSKSPEAALVSQQADINIFTVASGLLYEVGMLLHFSVTVLSFFTLALRWHHDTQCSEEHEQHCEVLVHREFPIALVLGKYTLVR